MSHVNSLIYDPSLIEELEYNISLSKEINDSIYLLEKSGFIVIQIIASEDGVIQYIIESK